MKIHNAKKSFVPRTESALNKQRTGQRGLSPPLGVNSQTRQRGSKNADREFNHSPSSNSGKTQFEIPLSRPQFRALVKHRAERTWKTFFFQAVRALKEKELHNRKQHAEKVARRKS